MPYLVIQTKKVLQQLSTDGMVEIAESCFVPISPPFYSSHDASLWRDKQVNKKQLIIIEFIE